MYCCEAHNVTAGLPSGNGPFCKQSKTAQQRTGEIFVSYRVPSNGVDKITLGPDKKQ
jgi:hypothetical protein